jgi:hypothetical protein
MNDLDEEIETEAEEMISDLSTSEITDNHHGEQIGFY